MTGQCEIERRHMTKQMLLLGLMNSLLTIPENPYFALDAFTRSNGLLVIGDGLLESLVDIGIDGEIAFTAVLSHEWWHQAQFEMMTEWDYIDQLSSQAEKFQVFRIRSRFCCSILHDP